MFGVATADHQCEAYDPVIEDIRDVWERTHQQTPRGRGTDFRNRYIEDIELARQMGCHVFRFSISWARVEPEPGVFSQDELEHYQRVIQAIRAAEMEPIVTLHHFTWPLHIEKRGGMISPKFPEYFCNYVREVVNFMGKDVRFWITFNEPSQLLFGYIKPWWIKDYFVPPGLPDGATLDHQIAAVNTLIRNLFLAHARARKIIKRNNTRAQVGSNPLLLGLPEWLQRIIDWNATRTRSKKVFDKQVRRYATLRVPAVLMPDPTSLKSRLHRLIEPIKKSFTVLSTLLASNWWHLGMAGKLPVFLCPKECVGQQDFVGFDFYWGVGNLDLNRINALIESGSGHFDHAPVHAEALYNHLKRLTRLFPKLPIMIIENGSVAVADGIDRATYLNQHTTQVKRALKDGIDVAGYICWSITSNREWGLPFGPGNDFGLYHIDLDTDPELKRTPTPAVAAYKAIICGLDTESAADTESAVAKVSVADALSLSAADRPA